MIHINYSKIQKKELIQNFREKLIKQSVQNVLRLRMMEMKRVQTINHLK